MYQWYLKMLNNKDLWKKNRCIGDIKGKWMERMWLRTKNIRNKKRGRQSKSSRNSKKKRKGKSKIKKERQNKRKQHRQRELNKQKKPNKRERHSKNSSNSKKKRKKKITNRLDCNSIILWSRCKNQFHLSTNYIRNLRENTIICNQNWTKDKIY